MAVPTGRHTDWPWPFSHIPRRWNAWKSDTPPALIWGTDDESHNHDIPEIGRWAVCGVGNVRIPVFFASRLQKRRKLFWLIKYNYLRIALIRYDYVDHYYTVFSMAIRNYD